MRAKPMRFCAGVLVAMGLVGLMPTVALAAAPQGARSATAFDNDPFEISGSGAGANGTAEWARGEDPRAITGRLSGQLTAPDGGCARVEIAWLNSANSTMRTSGARTCSGRSDGFAAAYSASGLECVRIRLLVDGEQAGSSKLLCAGGS